MNSIFVQIPAYHDLEIVKTIDSIFSSASKENTINVGIHFSYYETLPQIIEQSFLKKYSKGKINVIISKAPTGLGMQLSRYIANSMYNEEDFYLQIDSHMIFRKNWDLILIEDFNYLKNIYKNKIAISNIPLNYSYFEKFGYDWLDKPINSNVLNRHDFNKLESLLKLTIKPKNDKCKFRLNTDNIYNNISGAFVFSEGNIHEIYKETPNFSSGEELLTSMRLVSRNFKIVGGIRECVKHLGEHDLFNTLAKVKTINDLNYQKILQEYPRRIARIDFADMELDNIGTALFASEILGHSNSGNILANNMLIQEYLDQCMLELV